MSLAENIKNIRLQHGLQQKKVALDIDIAIPNYNRMEKGEREISVKVLEKLADLYKMTIDDIIHFQEDKKIPEEIQVQDKELIEQVKLIQELEPEEKSMVFKMIDTFINQKKFKDFVKQNVAI